MRKLLAYMRPDAHFLVLAFIFILLQACFELFIPAFTANLINIGIQNYGITNAAPDQLTAEDFSFVKTGMDASPQTLLEQSYTQSGSILQKKSLDSASEKQLDDAFSLSEWTVIYLAEELPGEAPSQSALHATAMSDLSTVDLEALRSAMPQLKTLPAAQWESARAKALQLTSDMRAQTGAAFAAAFYRDAGIDPWAIQRRYLIREGALMLCIAIAACLCALLGARYAAKSGAAFARNLRRAVFCKISGFSSTEFDRYGEATLVSRTTSDITLIQSSTISALRILFFSLCMGIGGVILAFRENVSLAWTIALALLVAVLIILLIFVLARPRYHIVQNMIDRLNLVVRESIEGTKTIRVFATQDHEENRYDAANDRLATTQLGINRILIFLSPSFTIIINLMSLLIVWLGAENILQTDLQVGDIVAYMQYAIAVFTSVVLIAGMFVIIPRVSVSAARVLEVLDTDPAVQDKGSIIPSADPMSLEAQNVFFTYQGARKKALEDVCLSAHPGQITAIVGPSGAGKTTLLKLLRRSYDTAQGTVRVFGEKIQNISLLHLRERVLCAPAQTGFWSGENYLRQSRELFSHDASVYILDDFGRGLSPQSQMDLMELSSENSINSIILIASARVRRIQHADKIYVMDRGRIVGFGTHDQLMRSSPLYRKMAEAEEN